MARRRRRPRSELRAFGSEIGLAFQLLDDVLDVTGPPERTGKARGTDLLDGTVTLPLILAAERDPVSPRSTCAAWTSVGPRPPATGSPSPGRWSGCERRRSRWSPPPSAACRGRRSTPSRRELLGLVADGVVERYS